MPNTLTNLIPVMYKGMDIARRELVGLIPAVDIDTAASAAAVNQAIRTPIIPVATTDNITPGQQPPDDGDQTIGYLDMAITKSKYSAIRWSGEELLGYNSNGQGEMTLARQFAESVRALTNEVEADLAALFINASRAHGTAGAAPFATDLSDPANVLKILLDNGAPQIGDKQMIINTTAGAKLRSLATLNKANEAGTTELREMGKLLNIHGFDIRESAAIKASTTQAAAANYVIDGAHAARSTTLTIKTGVAAIKAGTLFTIADGGGHVYVVAADYAGGAGNLSINAPGLVVAAADTKALTVATTQYAANMAFERNAIKLLARTPAMPDGGDAADDVMTITDPISGLSFQVAMYRLYRRVKYEVGLAWGVKTVKPEFLSLLLG